MTTYFCDSNVWVALSVGGHVHNEAVMAWLATVDPPDTIVMCRTIQLSYLRLVTTRAVIAAYDELPMTNVQAWAACQAFLADDRIVFRDDEPASLPGFWNEYAMRSTASPKLWMDAYLAAFARAAGYRLVTTDGDFRQFPGLDLVLLTGGHAP